jgi:hypothetical protein
MRFVDAYSADMDDIFMDERRLGFLKWAGDFLKAIADSAVTTRTNPPVVASDFVYRPGKKGRKIAAGRLKIRIISDPEARDRTSPAWWIGWPRRSRET